MDFDELYPKRFLKAGQFKGKDWTLTIADVLLEKLDGRKGPEVKGIICFAETAKQLVLNVTNGHCLKVMFGRKTENWIGKKITLFPAEIKFEDSDLAIRVRGSPDIAETFTFKLELARKKPRMVTLQKTGSVKLVNPAKPAAAEAGAAPRPAPVPVAATPADHGEPPADVLLPTGKRTTAAPAKAARRVVIEDKSEPEQESDPVTGEVFDEGGSDPFSDDPGDEGVAL